MDEIICKCGKSKVSYEVIGEDLWTIDLENCKKIKDKKIGEIRCVCNFCNEIVDRCDMYMIADWD